MREEIKRRKERKKGYNWHIKEKIIKTNTKDRRNMRKATPQMEKEEKKRKKQTDIGRDKKKYYCNINGNHNKEENMNISVLCKKFIT